MSESSEVYQDQEMTLKDEFQSDQEEDPEADGMEDQDEDPVADEESNLIILGASASDVLANMESESDPDDPSQSEKVIHIASSSGSRSDESKPAISGLPQKPTVSIISSNVGAVFLCPDVNCKLRLPSRNALLTHVEMCHSKVVTGTTEKKNNKNEVEDLEDDDVITIKHKSGVSKFKIRECIICSYLAKNEADLKRHTREIHAKKFPKIKCDQCDATFDKKIQFLRHRKMAHENVKIHACDSCDFKTNNINSMKKHKYNKHIAGGDSDIKYSVDYLNNLPPGVKEEDLKCLCTWCPFKSNQYKVVKKHIEIHHEKKNHYPCKECYYVAENVEDYAKHYMEFHKTDSYPHACTDCSFRCTNKADLKQHYILEHSKQKLYVCKSCNFRSFDVHTIRKHILRVHPSFRCDYCDFSSETKDALFTHQYNEHGLHLADINPSDDMKVVIINSDEHTIFS